MITIENALRIAVEAHEGQKDLDGIPVILHPMTVAVAGRNRERTGMVEQGVLREDEAVVGP